MTGNGIECKLTLIGKMKKRFVKDFFFIKPIDKNKFIFCIITNVLGFKKIKKGKNIFRQGRTQKMHSVTLSQESAILAFLSQLTAERFILNKQICTESEFQFSFKS